MQCSYVTVVLKAFLMLCLIGHYPKKSWFLFLVESKQRLQTTTFFPSKDWYISIVSFSVVFTGYFELDNLKRKSVYMGSWFWKSKNMATVRPWLLV